MRVAIDGSAVGAEPSGARTRLLRLLLAYAELPGRHDLVVHVTAASGLREPFTAAGLECVVVAPPPPPWRRLSGRIWRERLDLARADVFQAETLPVPPPPGRPLLLTLHDLRDVTATVAVLPRALYVRWLLPRALARVERVIAVSEHTRQEVIGRLGVPPERVAVVGNAADAGVGPAAVAEQDAFRARFGLPRRFVLALGHLEPRKGLPLLVAAVARLRRAAEFADVTLVLAGSDRGEASRLRRQAAAAGVPLVLTGVLTDTDRARALSAANVLALPSRLEGFGIVPLEAMLASCPVVAARTGAVPEVTGDAAWLFEPGDAAALAVALRRVLAEPALAERLRAAGAVRAARFSWERSARALHAVYEAVQPGGAPLLVV